MPIKKEPKDTKPIGYRARKEAQRQNKPRNGDTTIKEGNKFVYKDGKWVKASTKPTPSAGRRTNPKAAKPAAKPTPKPTVADYSDAQGNTYDGNSGRLKASAQTRPAASADVQPILRSPAAAAPIHASPGAFGSAYTPQVPQRPSTPGQAAMQQPPMSPQYGGNDEPGRLGQQEGGYAGKPQQPAPPASGVEGVDYERRRAFLDADNSLDGMKAVKDLLNRRKLSISVEN